MNNVNPFNKQQQGQNSVVAQKQQIEHTFKRMQGQFIQALPKHIDFNRFMRVALNAVTNTPKLLECDRPSFFLAVMRAAQLGLEPDGLMGQAYLIPYGKSVQLQVGYKGYITLARQSGDISFITAECVHENDEFDLNIFGTPRFSPYLKGDRGALLGFIAVARFKDDTYQYVFMTTDEVNEIRDKTQAWKQALKDAKYDDMGNLEKFVNKWGKEIESVPWFHHYKEMGKKTAIRRLAKYLPLSVQKAEKMESLQESGISFDVDNHGEIVETMQDITPSQDDQTEAPEQVEKETPPPSLEKTEVLPEPQRPAQPQITETETLLGESMDDMYSNM